ncbi:MAG TPA: hypothetical protein VJI46_07055 [Candidatus Nanoarchaeia archaeon]|nr:hypothetical protein [Candidatus Nanoarchaeia archaeon]
MTAHLRTGPNIAHLVRKIEREEEKIGESKKSVSTLKEGIRAIYRKAGVTRETCDHPSVLQYMGRVTSDGRGDDIVCGYCDMYLGKPYITEDQSIGE